MARGKNDSNVVEPLALLVVLLVGDSPAVAQNLAPQNTLPNSFRRMDIERNACVHAGDAPRPTIAKEYDFVAADQASYSNKGG